MVGTEGKSSKVIEGDLAAYPGKPGQAVNKTNSGLCVLQGVRRTRSSKKPWADEPQECAGGENPGDHARRRMARTEAKSPATVAKGGPAKRLKRNHSHPRMWSRKPERGAPNGYVPPNAASWRKRAPLPLSIGEAEEDCES
jgi:hypothetical protein